ncbi:MAG: HEPN domain-containing protein [Alphaproteobacteria bacterium]|nr:HEPN domain-containing protein [Alphaproteobacteria bacterium]
MQPGRNWWRQANHDFAHARLSLARGAHDWAAQAAQQAAERALKALLIAGGEVPPRSHDLPTLLRQARKTGLIGRALDRRKADLAMLSQLQIAARYPLGEDQAPPMDSIPAKQARAATATARAVLMAVAKVLGSDDEPA